MLFRSEYSGPQTISKVFSGRAILWVMDGSRQGCVYNTTLSTKAQLELTCLASRSASLQPAGLPILEATAPHRDTSLSSAPHLSSECDPRPRPVSTGSRRLHADARTSRRAPRHCCPRRPIAHSAAFFRRHASQPPRSHFLSPPSSYPQSRGLARFAGLTASRCRRRTRRAARTVAASAARRSMPVGHQA